MDFLKSNGISYADIAERNMLASYDGDYKIIDFGYSKLNKTRTVTIDELS